LLTYVNFVITDVASRIFAGLVFRIAEPGLFKDWPGDMTRYAVVPSFTVLYQPAALSGARKRSVSSWHGMPTASVKNKLFLS
jgi:hypothetical protein